MIGPWATLLAAAPFGASLVALGVRTTDGLRRLGVVTSAAVLGVALLAVTAGSDASTPALSVLGHARSAHLGVVLLPVTALVALAALLAAPRADIDRTSVAGCLFAQGATALTLLSDHLWVFAAGWIASIVPLFLEARRAEDGALRRAAALLAVTAGGAVLALAVLASVAAGGVTAATLSALESLPVDHPVPYRGVFAALVGVAAASRLGVVPFHLWVPPVLQRGRAVTALVVVLSPLGSYAAVRLGVAVVPDLLRPASGWLLLWATASALYGAALAYDQHDARRLLAYAWTSTASFLFAGLCTVEVRGMTGAFVHELGASLTFAGLLLLTRAVAARTGTADLRRLGGLVARGPGLATGYFLLALAAVGFPGAATFVSEDLIAQSVLHDHGLLAVLLLLGPAINGVTLLRGYKRIFLGPPSPHTPGLDGIDDLLPRERRVFVALILLLLAGGFLPGPALAAREAAVTFLHADAP